MKTVKYVTGIPRKALPAGHVVVHNHIRPDRDPTRGADGPQSMADVPIGMNGFRVWIAAPDDDERIGKHYSDRDPYVVVRCDCAWAPELPEHYRVDLAKREPVDA